MSRRVCSAVAVAGLACALAACASEPPKKAIQPPPIDTSPDSISGVRKQLMGRWVLESLSMTAVDGRVVAIDAVGALASDPYGNLEIEYRLSDSGRQTLAALGIDTPNPVISTTGHVVIDPQQKQIVYVAPDGVSRAVNFDPDLASRRANPFALERTRYYEFAADGTLTLSTRYDNGKDAIVARWKKLP